ncbi:MBL fold metallo-hydrolase RNA specificity domain-containing protein [Niabella drilacis]|uniref:Metallo-beta-lactamase family protein n=1 Tax=Niabella drilacis (strain DSM 25811 / CCM 8410 / CCUG 62505 / LMG 26954 / E90) TaxID=1285928 RepID=A0A1G6V2H2_NIADE|nr:MBL fold metallo-hydrolase [Niabella drilacis]SDD47738.1 metallo-beta-lactamase family protein [Niabella drilacis]
MKIAFHGAAQTVTGSKHLITLKNGKKILLDCGMYQGMGDRTDSLNRDFGFISSEVDVMILSHAHIDHSGLIPKLVKEGFGGKIFCSPATKDLTNILLMDSAEIQESDMRFLEKKRQGAPSELLRPLYTVEDAKRAMGLFEAREYNLWFDVLDGVRVMFTDAGHIIGSQCVHLQIKEDNKETRITFSGDLGRYRDVILRSPEVFPQADYIIMESTYGNSLHEDIKDTPQMLLEWINKVCVERKGKLIFPAFSVGRTQELLYALNQLEAQNLLPKIPFYVDSPLSIEATDVVKRFPLYFNRQIQNVLKNDDDPFSFPGLGYVKSVDESKSLNFKNGPMVIISASGMADAGRVKHHISNNIENSRNAIVMTGYCEPHSLGGRLLAGVKEVGIFGVEHQVNAEIGQIRSMSAHGDYEDMSQWLACQDPNAVKQLFLVHGEPDVQVAFKQRLVKKGFVDVLIPERHFEIGLG